MEAKHGYEHVDTTPENTVQGEPRYFVYMRKQGEDEQHLFAKRGSRKKARKSISQCKRQYPTAVMAAILDREKDEVTFVEEWDEMKTVKYASTETLLHELAERFLRRKQTEALGVVQDLIRELRDHAATMGME